MTLNLIRGLPGSGKSTYAKSLCALHLEADMYFMRDWTYQFDSAKIKDAHKWCQHATKLAMETGMDVTVSNTFCTRREIQPYLDLAKTYGYKVNLVEMKNQYGSIHNVPETVLDNMKARWEIFNL